MSWDLAKEDLLHQLLCVDDGIILCCQPNVHAMVNRSGLYYQFCSLATPRISLVLQVFCVPERKMDAEIWEEEFDCEIVEREIYDSWTLNVDENLQKQKGWLQYTQRTFGRFRCSKCRRRWNSAEIHVLFLMKLNKALKQGTVKMRIFKQECKKCTLPLLEKPEISEENIVRIISNVCNRIQQMFYGKKKTNSDLQPEVQCNNMEGPHEKEHCEACKLNICKYQKPLSSYTEYNPLSYEEESFDSYEEYSPSQCESEIYEYYQPETESKTFTTNTNYKPPKPKKSKKKSKKKPLSSSTEYKPYKEKTFSLYEEYRPAQWESEIYGSYTGTQNHQPETKRKTFTTDTNYKPPKTEKDLSIGDLVVPLVIGLGALGLWLMKKF